VYQYLPFIKATGFEVRVSSFFDDTYLINRYSKNVVNARGLLSAAIRRLWAVLTVRHGITVFVEYEVLPYLPPLAERWLIWRGCKLIIDYDDAIFHRYDTHPNPWVRVILGKKIAKLMRLADTVLVGNRYLADYAYSAGATRVVKIPTVVDLTRYTVKNSSQKSVIFTIGWIGSPSTAPYLHVVAPALAQMCRGGGVRVCLIGSGPMDFPGVLLELVPWLEETEVAEIQKFDVGIMPLPDEPWTRGKCGFKLIQYMACGLPVVASPVGVNVEMVRHGVNGYLASTMEEWVCALESLRADLELRHRMGTSGRRRVEEEYCLAVTAPKLVETIKQCAV
jgi:glycosyltransferase involved in cell wall biosynthesis